MNDLSIFDSLFGSGFDFPTYSGKSRFSVPSVDVKEYPKAYVLEMDLPGFLKEDIEMNLKDNVLTISSSKNNEKENSSEEKNEFTWLVKERKTYHFKRSFTLPKDVDSEKIEASFNNGVLLVNISRKELSPEKRIEITSN